MASRRRDRRQALDEAFLRYGGEADQLTSLLKSIKGDTRSQVQQARRGARMLAASARQAIPNVQKNYDYASTAADVHDTSMRDELAKLGPAAAGFQAALAFEKGGGARLAEARAASLDELVGRATGAKAQGQQEIRSIRASGQADKAKVLDQLLSNRKQAGTFAASRFGELRGDAAKTRNANKQKAKDRAQSNRNSQRSAGIDPKTGKPIPGGKLDPKTKGPAKWASPAEQNKAQDQIGEAIKQAKKLKAAGRSRQEIGDLLVTGRPTQTIDDGNGNKVKVPAIPSYSEIYASAALDLVYGKAITRQNVTKLHKRGIKVRKLGYPTGKNQTEANIQAGLVAGPPAPGA